MSPGGKVTPARVLRTRQPRFALLTAAVVLAGCTAAQPVAQSSCKHRNPGIERDIGYCQTVRIGDTYHVSGITGSAPMDRAVANVYDQLRATLADNGLTFADVVKETVYATDLDAFIAQKDVRKNYYGDHLPAATWVQVERLYLPQFVVEVELTAVKSR